MEVIGVTILILLCTIAKEIFLLHLIKIYAYSQVLMFTYLKRVQLGNKIQGNNH